MSVGGCSQNFRMLSQKKKKEISATVLKLYYLLFSSLKDVFLKEVLCSSMFEELIFFENTIY